MHFLLCLVFIVPISIDCYGVFSVGTRGKSRSSIPPGLEGGQVVLVGRSEMVVRGGAIRHQQYDITLESIALLSRIAHSIPSMSLTRTFSAPSNSSSTNNNTPSSSNSLSRKPSFWKKGFLGSSHHHNHDNHHHSNHIGGNNNSNSKGNGEGETASNGHSSHNSANSSIGGDNSGDGNKLSAPIAMILLDPYVCVNHDLEWPMSPPSPPSLQSPRNSKAKSFREGVDSSTPSLNDDILSSNSSNNRGENSNITCELDSGFGSDSDRYLLRSSSWACSSKYSLSSQASSKCDETNNSSTSFQNKASEPLEGCWAGFMEESDLFYEMASRHAMGGGRKSLESWDSNSNKVSQSNPNEQNDSTGSEKKSNSGKHSRLSGSFNSTLEFLNLGSGSGSGKNRSNVDEEGDNHVISNPIFARLLKNRRPAPELLLSSSLPQCDDPQFHYSQSFNYRHHYYHHYHQRAPYSPHYPFDHSSHISFSEKANEWNLSCGYQEPMPHLVILVAGYQGKSYDMRLLADTIVTVFPDVQV